MALKTPPMTRSSSVSRLIRLDGRCQFCDSSASDGLFPAGQLPGQGSAVSLLSIQARFCRALALRLPNTGGLDGTAWSRRGDIFLPPGEMTAIRQRLRELARHHDLVTVIACAFDHRTRILPFFGADLRMVPAGVRAIGSALADVRIREDADRAAAVEQKLPTVADATGWPYAGFVLGVQHAPALGGVRPLDPRCLPNRSRAAASDLGGRSADDL